MAALQRQRAAVGVDGAEHAGTLAAGIRDGQRFAAVQRDRCASIVESKSVQVDDERIITPGAEIDIIAIAVSGSIVIQRQRAAVGQPTLDRLTDIIIGRIAHPCQDAVLIAVQACAILRVGVRTFYDLDFLDRIVTFQFACIFQKRSVLPEGIALCQQVAQFDRIVAYIRDLIVSTAVETCSISALGKRQRIDLPCAVRTDKPAVLAGYRYIADVAVIACPLAQIQCTVRNDKYLIHTDKTAAARNDQLGGRIGGNYLNWSRTFT